MDLEVFWPREIPWGLMRLMGPIGSLGLLFLEHTGSHRGTPWGLVRLLGSLGLSWAPGVYRCILRSTTRVTTNHAQPHAYARA
eukprot:1783996-Pyramimonas_sp.AAC.1